MIAYLNFSLLTCLCTFPSNPVGLSTLEVGQRLETVGLNTILVRAPSLLENVFAEFSSAFYVYQVRYGGASLPFPCIRSLGVILLLCTHYF